jgi:hypothetical protein
MQPDRYQLKAEESLMVFEVISNGPKGQIPKQFAHGYLDRIFNAR